MILRFCAYTLYHIKMAAAAAGSPQEIFGVVKSDTDPLFHSKNGTPYGFSTFGRRGRHDTYLANGQHELQVSGHDVRINLGTPDGNVLTFTITGGLRRTLRSPEQLHYAFVAAIKNLGLEEMLTHDSDFFAELQELCGTREKPRTQAQPSTAPRKQLNSSPPAAAAAPDLSMYVEEGDAQLTQGQIDALIQEKKKKLAETRVAIKAAQEEKEQQRELQQKLRQLALLRRQTKEAEDALREAEANPDPDSFAAKASGSPTFPTLREAAALEPSIGRKKMPGKRTTSSTSRNSFANLPPTEKDCDSWWSDGVDSGADE